MNRTVPRTEPHSAPEAADEQPAAGDDFEAAPTEAPPSSSAQVHATLSRVIAQQRASEASLTALAKEIRQLADARRSVDSRGEASLSRVIDQLLAIQETLGRQSAATEMLQARLDGIVSLLTGAGATPTIRNGGDRALYWSVAALAVISLTSLGFGISSLIH